MSGVFGYENRCGKRLTLDCPFSVCNKCPIPEWEEWDCSDADRCEDREKWGTEYCYDCEFGPKTEKSAKRKVVRRTHLVDGSWYDEEVEIDIDQDGSDR